MNPPLIASKLALPPEPQRLVARPRIREALRAALDRHRVVSVEASAGAGKTTAVADAVRWLGHPVAWLTVDRSDRTAGRLLTYLEAAVAPVVPRCAEVATRAMTARVPHAEAAGMLGEAVGDAEVVIVLDAVERLERSESAWSVVDGFLRYTCARVVLVGRESLPGQLMDVPLNTVGRPLADPELAFTTSEAELALRELGRDPALAPELVAATGGWVAGVVYGFDDREPGNRPVPGPLQDFMVQQVLGRLPEALQQFVIQTSPLVEVDAARASALGVSGPARHLAALRLMHLPATWDADRGAVRFHPVFRDVLQDLLDLLPAEQARQVRVAHGRLLAADGDDEAAVATFLRGGAHRDALDAARRAVSGVIDRADLDLAQEWLDSFADDESPDTPTELTTAQLAIHVVRDQYRRGVGLCDRLAAADTRTKLAHNSSRAAVLMAWLYAIVGRKEDALAVVEAAAPTPEIRAISYGLSLMDPPGSFERARLCGEPVDAYVLECDYYRGRLDRFTEPSATRWAQAVTGPFTIAAMRARGETQRALETYRDYTSQLGELALRTFVGPEVLFDAGLTDEARRTLEEGKRFASSVGAPMYELLSLAVEAKILARGDGDGDPAAALAVTAAVAERAEFDMFWCVRAMAWVWRGLALLRTGNVATAAAELRRTVTTMRSVEGTLELPTAAVYLAEAEWRLGNEAAADAAADIALDAARRQGSYHLLLQALSDYPEVASRRLDAERGTGPWHEVGRQLGRQCPGRIPPPADGPAMLHFLDLGGAAVTMDGVPVRCRLTKSYELLAFLLRRPERAATRELLLTALFDGRADDAARAYLRQAVRWLKVLLPINDMVVTDRRMVRLSADLRIRVESTVLESAVVEAARLHGCARVAALEAAEAIAARGPYLDGIDSAWVIDRRMEVHDLATEVRFNLAAALHDVGRLPEARRKIEDALSSEAFRESGWRLLMRIAAELGDHDGVLLAYRRCEEALATIGTTPSQDTRAALRALSA